VNATSTDAVNGSQLHETNQNIAALDKNAVKYKLSPDGTQTNTVKLEGGDPNAPVLIKNVAEAKEGTDAVNKNQLDLVDKKIIDQTNTINERVKTIETQANRYIDEKFDDAKRYTDQQFNKLSSDIGSVRKEAHQAAAIGLAAASLHYDNTPGKISVATGGGLWQGQAAMAFGAGYTSESGKVRANISGATSGGKFGVGAGVSFTLN
jgi:autotransporter adhesin